MRFASFLAALASASVLALAAPDADACGGCFVPQGDSTVVAGHRMALSLSTTQTVLWDQIQYAGDPAEFAWVLPVKKGARVELSTDAFFEVLDAATTTTVRQPAPPCFFDDFGGHDGGGFGCGSSAEASGGEADPSAGGGQEDVTVLHQGSVGPYETVTLSTDVAGALNEWLDDHGYNVDDASQPIIDAYVAEGFDFVALRLQPGQGVRAMKPVRVVSPGADPLLPLRMVAIGTGPKVPLVLFVVGEGRWEADNFPNVAIPLEELSWDFASQTSNYGELRAAALSAEGGRGWLTNFARPRGLLENLGYGIQTSNSVQQSIGQAYFQQGLSNGEAGVGSAAPGCQDPSIHAPAQARVVPDCEGCPEPGYDEISASHLTCGKLDDLAVALTGMRPADAWLTRLESDLPREALGTDLGLRASASQEAVSSLLDPAVLENEEAVCGEGAGALAAPRRPFASYAGGVVGLGLGSIALLALARRRRFAREA